MAGDLRAVLRMAAEREPEPSAVILDSRRLRSSPESRARVGYDGARRKPGSMLHLAVNTPGHVVALHVTPANADDHGEVGRLTSAAQTEVDGRVEKAFADQGYTDENAAAAARLTERSFAWTTRCRRLVRDHERYATTLAGFHLVAFGCLMLRQAERLMTSS